MSDGYSVNMRRAKTGEYLAVIPDAYDSGRGRYYMAFTLLDGWVELSPEYVTRHTRTVTDYPLALKKAVDRNLGYLLNTVGRLAG